MSTSLVPITPDPASLQQAHTTRYARLAEARMSACMLSVMIGTVGAGAGFIAGIAPWSVAMVLVGIFGTIAFGLTASEASRRRDSQFMVRHAAEARAALDVEERFLASRSGDTDLDA